MTGKHPGELDLARLSDSEAGEDLSEHLRWCSSCRRILADYDWLQEEIAEALNARAEAAPVAGPDWESVHKRLRSSRERVSDRRLLVAVSAALIACVMLVAPSLLGREVQAQTRIAAELSAVPQPVMASSADANAQPGSLFTVTTHADTVMAASGTVSLPFVPPPTPPDG